MARLPLSGLFVVLATTLFAQHYEPLCRVPYRNGRQWGYCDTLGRVLLPPQFDSTTIFRRTWICNEVQNVVAMVKSGGNWGIIDTHWRWVVPAEFAAIEWLHTDGQRTLFKVKKQGQWGLYGPDLRPMLPLRFDRIEWSGQRIETEQAGVVEWYDLWGNVWQTPRPVLAPPPTLPPLVVPDSNRTYELWLPAEPPNLGGYESIRHFPEERGEFFSSPEKRQNGGGEFSRRNCNTC